MAVVLKLGAVSKLFLGICTWYLLLVCIPLLYEKKSYRFLYMYRKCIYTDFLVFPSVFVCLLCIFGFLHWHQNLFHPSCCLAHCWLLPGDVNLYLGMVQIHTLEFSLSFFMWLFISEIFSLQ